MEKKVYLIWYECDLGKALWGVCESLETAKKVIARIKRNFGYEATWTDEVIIED